MISAQVAETSVMNSNSFQNYPNPESHDTNYYNIAAQWHVARFWPIYMFQDVGSSLKIVKLLSLV